MPKIFRLNLQFVFLLFSVNVLEAQVQNSKIDSLTNCERKVIIESISFCVPVIDGMVECYNHPIVKKRADDFEYETNSVVAYYLNKKTYDQVDKIDQIKFDDYFKIYIHNDLIKDKFSTKEFIEISKILEGNYVRLNWPELKNKIEKNHDYLSVGVPIIINSYTIMEKAKSYAMIAKYIIEDYEYVLVFMLNLLHVDNRLIWVAYYLNYEDDESIKKAKSKNDYIVMRILDENK